MNYVDDGAWSCGLEVFQEDSGMASVRIRGIYALCREIIEALEIRIPETWKVLIGCILYIERI